MIFLHKFKSAIKSNSLLTVIAHNLIERFHFLYSEKEYSIVKLIGKPVIVDVGAHNGESIYNFLKYNSSCKIISIEPNVKNFNLIRNKYKKDKRISCLNKIVSQKKGQEIFYTPILLGKELSQMSSTSLDLLKKRISFFFNIKLTKFSFKKTKVKTTKIDSLNLKPNIIKIDTEGSEYEILLTSKKTIKKNKPLIIVEYNHNNFNKILNLMKKFGYKPYIFDKNFVLLDPKKKSLLKKNTNANNVVFLPEKTPKIEVTRLKYYIN